MVIQLGATAHRLPPVAPTHAPILHIVCHAPVIALDHEGGIRPAGHEGRSADRLLSPAPVAELESSDDSD